MISLSFLPNGETIQKRVSALKKLSLELNFLTETPSKGFGQYPLQVRPNHLKRLDL
jgi:hypothetical protein